MATSVGLRTVWLNDAAEPSQRVSFPYLAELSVARAQVGEVRRYAGGRLRAVSVLGNSAKVSLSARAVTREQVAWLEAHIGRTVCVRDDRGRRLFAVYWEVPVEEHAYDGEAEVSLELAQVTLAEAI